MVWIRSCHLRALPGALSGVACISVHDSAGGAFRSKQGIHSQVFRSMTTNSGGGISRKQSKECTRKHINAPGPHRLRRRAQLRSHVSISPYGSYSPGRRPASGNAWRALVKASQRAQEARFVSALRKREAAVLIRDDVGVRDRQATLSRQIP